MSGSRARCILIGLIAVSIAQAEDLATEGTFEGTYHQDRWGVGRFGYFVVDSSLREQLAPFDSLRIKLQVKKGSQPVNPGTAYIHSVGKIEVLPDSPLALHLECIPPQPTPNEPFQLICFLHNSGTQVLDIPNEAVTLTLRRPKHVDRPDEPAFEPSGYTRGQMAVDQAAVQMFQRLVKADDGYANVGPADRIRILPNESFPLVMIYEKGLPAGEFEFGAQARAPVGAGHAASVAWLPLIISKPTKSRGIDWEPLRLGNRSVETLSNEYQLIVTFAADGDRRVVVASSDDTTCISGRIRAFAADGKEIALETNDGGSPDEPWHLASVATIRSPAKIKFRQASQFSELSMRRLVLDFLTEKGVESHVISDTFTDSHAFLEKTPFGESLHGVKIRGRPAAAQFKKGDPVRIHMQAVNTSGLPIVWWTPLTVCSDAVALEVDGKAAKVPAGKAEYVRGWAGSWTCDTPVDWTVAVPDSLTMAPGKHSLRYSVVSSSGDYTNSVGDKVPLLNGRLISNLIAFEIRE